ncbi:MAG: ABC transporter permease [Bowdeniella nasicola]|nr:ABC transporter permease [Bowdeniella nasicola]
MTGIVATRRVTRRSAHPIHLGAPLVFAVTILIGWQLLAGVVNPIVLPPPAAVARRLISELADHSLWPYLRATATSALAGAGLGALGGIPLGWAIAISRVLRHTLSPWIAVSQAIPAIALAPLLVMWVGYGMMPTVVLCALMVFFPIVLTTHLGVRDLDPDLIDAARLDGAAGFSLVRYIQAPLAAPAILTGLRGGLTLSITGAVVGEFVMGGKGLGMLLTVYRDSADTEGVFAVLIVLCTLAALLYLLISFLEYRLRESYA